MSSLPPELLRYQAAEANAKRRLRFYRHAVIWGMTVLFLFFAADLEAAVVVGLLWGIFLATQGFGAVWGPQLERLWIDEEVQAAEALASGERRAMEGRHARSLEELSASIAHEIRNPITAAKSLVQQMGEDPRAAENVEYAKIALAELDRVEKSISHLLRYAREEELKLGEVDLTELVDSAVETFKDRTAKHAIRIDRDVDALVPMRADSEKLRRILINLVSNACDALEEARVPEPTIRISAGANLAGSEVWLRVKDNGPGIAPDKIASIFTPFYTSKTQGTGLGLAITKKMVDAHGGRIEVASKPGEGAEFVVSLPRPSTKELS